MVLHLDTGDTLASLVVGDSSCLLVFKCVIPPYFCTHVSFKFYIILLLSVSHYNILIRHNCNGVVYVFGIKIKKFGYKDCFGICFLWYPRSPGGALSAGTAADAQ